MQFYVIQTGLFLETKSFMHLVVPLNNFAPNNNCIWMQDKSNKHPLLRCVCVWGGDSYSMIVPQYLVSLITMNMHI